MDTKFGLKEAQAREHVAQERFESAKNNFDSIHGRFLALRRSAGWSEPTTEAHGTATNLAMASLIAAGAEHEFWSGIVLGLIRAEIVTLTGTQPAV